jgi:hypothetical protein
MNARTMVAVLLITAGALAFGYGGFTYTKDSRALDVGSLHVSVEKKQHVSIPIWVGVAAMLMGGAMLSFGRRN